MVRYSMIISHEHRFIYFAPVKTGTASMIQVLSQNFAAFKMGYPDSGAGWHYGRFPQHVMIFPDAFDDYVTFVTVRNPYTRFPSLYNFFSQDGADPFLFAESNVAEPMVDAIWGSPWVPMGFSPPRIDHVLRLETLERDFNRLPFVKSHMQVPHGNKAKRRILTVTPAIQEMIRERYKSDFEYFGYDPTICPIVS
jgi:hypothetical protein